MNHIHIKDSQFKHYSIALDENTDITDTVKIISFYSSNDKNYVVTEKLAALKSIKEEANRKSIYLCFNTAILI